MGSIRETHREAMEHWDKFLAYRREGKRRLAMTHGTMAFILEQAAAEKCVKEPSKSILTDSAKAMFETLNK